MRYPSKVIPFGESTFAYFLPILEALGDNQYTPLSLYTKIKKHKRPPTDEYIDALVCLQVLGKIRLDEQMGVLRRVN